jgi:hypothetical protein
VKKKTPKKKSTLKSRVRLLEDRAADSDQRGYRKLERIFRVERDVSFLGSEVRRHDEILDDQSKRIQSVEDHQWWTENSF